MLRPHQLITHPFRRAYRELIGDRRHQTSFWILTGFLAAFFTARLLVAADPGLFLHIRGIHVHHFTYGIIVLAIAGFVSIMTEGPAKPWLAVFYGIGLALSFDEFGMWVRLTDNYNLDQSEDIMVAISVFLVIIVYFAHFLRRAARYIRFR